MEEINNRKKAKFAIALIIIIVCFAVTVKILIVKPKYINKVKANNIYIGGFEKTYPNENDPRFYIEFKEDGTFVAMQDDSRGNEEDYHEDGAIGSPSIEIYFGRYNVIKDNYMLTTTDSAGVKFSDTDAVKKKKINYYSRGIFEGDKRIAKNQGRVAEKSVIITKNGYYVLGYMEKSGSYDRHRYYCILYNKSDIKKLPGSVEEFRKQFKMDKKVEQDRKVYGKYYRENATTYAVFSR